MTAARRALRHGRDRPPRCRPGRVLLCDVRGEVVVCGVTDGRIPWPVGKRGRARLLVVTGGLAPARPGGGNAAGRPLGGGGRGERRRRGKRARPRAGARGDPPAARGG